MAKLKTEYTTNALTEALKEAGRVVLLSIIPVIILGIDVQNGGFNINWVLVEATGILTALRFADKWLHESGKEEGNSLKAGGITRF